MNWFCCTNAPTFPCLACANIFLLAEYKWMEKIRFGGVCGVCGAFYLYVFQHFVALQKLFFWVWKLLQFGGCNLGLPKIFSSWRTPRYQHIVDAYLPTWSMYLTFEPQTTVGHPIIIPNEIFILVSLGALFGVKNVTRTQSLLVASKSGIIRSRWQQSLPGILWWLLFDWSLGLLLEGCFPKYRTNRFHVIINTLI